MHDVSPKMKPAKLLYFYEKLEKLVTRLPAPLQKPILQEITPVKKLFLCQRPPRIVLLGQHGIGKAHLINAFFNAEIVRPHEEQPTTASWQDFTRIGHGTIRLLDARRPASLDLVKSLLASETPDIFLFMRSAEGTDDEQDIEHCAAILEFVAQRHKLRPGVIGILVKHEHAENVEAARQQLHACLLTNTPISGQLVTTLVVSSFIRFRLDGSIDANRDDRENIDHLAQIITEELPEEAKLEMARLSRVRSAQTQIAHTLMKSITAICTAIGTQPIPLADFPILTSLQLTMVGGIMYISGRDVSARLAAEFIAMLGANVGVGLVLREGSRALLKLFPGWGNAISGALAGAGTYAIGKAAIAYFIEGVSIQDARSLFRRKKHEQTKLLRDR